MCWRSGARPERRGLRTVLHSVFLRLLALYLLLTMPIIAFGIVIHSRAISAIRDQIGQSIRAKGDYFLRNLDTELQRVRLLQYDFLNDRDLNDLTYIASAMHPFERSQKLLAVQSRLHSLRSSSRYVEEGTVYLTDMDRTISARDGIMEGRAAALDAYAGARLLSARYQIDCDSDYLYSSVTDLQYAKAGKPPAFSLTAVISLEKIRGDLAQFAQDGSRVVLAGPDGMILFPAQPGETDMSLAELAQADGQQPGSQMLRVGDAPCLVSFVADAPLGLSMIQATPESHLLSHVGQYRLWLWLYVLLAAALFGLFALSIYRMIHKPLRLLKAQFARVETGDLNNRIVSPVWDEFHYLYDGFNRMLRNLDHLIDQNCRQQLLVQTAQLKQLQSQIDPHFLYNTFFILQSLAEAEDKDTLTAFLRQLGVYFKYITRSGGDEMPLEREVEHARTYASIQELRFSNRIHIRFDPLPPRLAQLPVPRLILQPLLENAFKYALEGKEGMGALWVRFQESGDTLRIRVEDNGEIGQDRLDAMQASLDSAALHREITALINIHKRLRLRFGEGSGLTLGRSELGGLRVEIVIQAEEDSDVQAADCG